MLSKFRRNIIVFESVNSLKFVFKERIDEICNVQDINNTEKGKLYLHFLLFFEQLQPVEMPSQTLELGP